MGIRFCYYDGFRFLYKMAKSLMTILYILLFFLRPFSFAQGKRSFLPRAEQLILVIFFLLYHFPKNYFITYFISIFIFRSHFTERNIFGKFVSKITFIHYNKNNETQLQDANLSGLFLIIKLYLFNRLKI